MDEWIESDESWSTPSSSRKFMNNLEYAYVGFAGDGEINQIEKSNTSRETRYITTKHCFL